ncbi:VanZ family protein [Streptomyces beijiangensis]|uniref:VanZ family protein n=1 Tax=Streptomyces beijiangensis TaxID=163361 RepID=A0A939JLW7_9ACTN|nr:VanZ family protein [Streptomyces beijiangensis]MBO0517307.1 VanZ family protein [Streptomyces beijiangensis]
MGGDAAIRFRVGGFLLLAAHLLLVGWLTLRPLDVMWVTASNFTPFAGIRADLGLGALEAVRRIGQGLALLAPLGVLLPLTGGRLYASPWLSFARTVAAGALISLTVELLQTGVPGQVVDIDSLLLNTVGVALAHLAVVPAGRAGLRRRKERSAVATLLRDEPPQGATPTIPRVGIAP